MTAKQFRNRHNNPRTGAHNTGPSLREGEEPVTPRAKHPRERTQIEARQ